MTKIKKSKIHRYLTYIITVLIISSILVGTIIFLNVGNIFGSEGEQVVYSNEYYILRGKPTDLQKSLFKDLTKQIELKNEKDLDTVELVVKSFIADYFTWSNKMGPYDVGGMTFTFGLENSNFYFTTRRSYYQNMANFIEQGLETKDLVEVESIEMGDASFAAPYNYYGKEYEAFYVEASWTYKENDKVDTSKFPNFGSFTVVLTEDNRFEIVRFY